MGKPKAPAPPNPIATAAAQTSTNVGTAVANAWLGNINETDSNGNTTSVDQTGSNVWNDPTTGQTYNIPKFTRTSTLSPQQQLIQDRNNQASLNLANIGSNLSGTLGEQLNGNFRLGNEATEARLMDLGRKRLDPILAQNDETLRTRLANQGIKAGSTAYDREMITQGQNRNDAYNQLLLTGRAAANQEAVTEDNQRINQISALMSGGQVSQPSFMGANMPTIATTDVAGLINQNYNQRQQNYQQKNAQYQATAGGLMGLGGKAISAYAMSDERTKENVEEVGTLKGHKLFEYNYKSEFGQEPGRHIGVMAQKVEKKRPDAVKSIGGIKHVNYGKLFEVGA
jgi:hypothetical protein